MSVGSTINQGYNKFALTAGANTVAEAIAIDAIFKKFYLPAVRDLLNNKKILTRYIRTNTEDVAGEEAIIAVNIGRNEGHGHIGEQGRLPDPMKQQYQNLHYGMKYFYGRILFSGPSISSSRNDRGAFIRIMDGEIKGVARDMQVDANRIWFGDGTGRLARLSAINSTTYTFTNPGGFDQNQGNGMQYIRNGMRVALVRSGGASALDTDYWATLSSQRGYFVINVNYAAGTCQFSTTQGGSAGTLATPVASHSGGWFLYRTSDTATDTDQISMGIMKEPWGLAAIVDDSDVTWPFSGNASAARDQYLGGLSATTYDIWRAAIVDNAGIPVPFSQDMFQQGSDLVDQVGDGNVQLWMGTHGIRRQYVNQLVSQKRFVGTMSMDGGYSAVEHNNRPFVVDKDCTRGRIYGLDLDTLMFFMENDYQWMDADGSMLQRLLDRDAYQATLYRFHQFGTDARNRNVGIFDIIDS